MPREARSRDWQQALILLTGCVVCALIVVALYWAKAVFVPVAFAIFLTFLLNPVVKSLCTRGMPRVASVLVVVTLAALCMGGLGWLVTRQTTGLLAKLPDYTTNIKAKVQTLRKLGSAPTAARLEDMLEEISRELAPASAAAARSLEGKQGATSNGPSLMVEADNSRWWDPIPSHLGGLLKSLASIALSVVLVVFMLLNHEDLRNRFIRLVGQGRVTFTTRAVDEAGHRISRYLLMQAVINICYGLIVTIVLLILRVDYALLWGFLAAALRYVPYVGPWIAAIFPIAMTLAMFDSWVQPLVLIATFIILELVTNNVAEPWLYGQSMGVSSVALLIAAAFWALLWGPIGLVLSAPLTVCLIVLGKYVPQLSFLDVLLGDQPALPPDVSCYQRLVARDQDEAADIVFAYAEANPREQIYDDLLIPVLAAMKRDRQRDELTEEDEKFILQSIREIMEGLEVENPVAPPADSAVGEGTEPQRIVVIMGCPARDEADRLALEMLAHLIHPLRWQLSITALATLTGELIDSVSGQHPSLICISALPPGGITHTRYLCKRLKSASPETKIVVGRWGGKGTPEQRAAHLKQTGADQIATSLLDARNQIESWYPVLAHETRAPDRAVPAPKMSNRGAHRTTASRESRHDLPSSSFEP